MRQTVLLAGVLWCGVATATQAPAQVPDLTGGTFQPRTLGAIIQESPHIAVLRVERLDTDQQIITFKKTADLKGKAPITSVRHRFTDFIAARDREAALCWAEAGKTVVCFHDGELCRVCLGSFWYLAWQGDAGEWRAGDDLEAFPVAYVGPPTKLCEHVKAILAGREVVVTAQPLADNPYGGSGRSPVYRDWLRGKKGRVWRIRAGLKIDRLDRMELDEAPNFVGWGAGGPGVVPALMASLREGDRFARAEAAEDLGQLDPGAARAARPALRAALGDADGHVRVHAALALARVDPGNQLTLPALVGMLKAADGRVREAAARALAELGPTARTSVPALTSVLRVDRQNEVRRVAAFALGRIAPDDSRATSPPGPLVAELARALKGDVDEGVRLWAARTLLKLGPGAREAVSALAAALQDRDRQVAGVAADALARFGPVAVPGFRTALTCPRCLVHGEIVYYLAEMGPAAQAAVPELLGRLQDRDESPWLRHSAAQALLEVDRKRGKAAALPVLEELLRDKNVRELALKVLGGLGREARGAAPSVVRLLREPDVPSDLRRNGVETLGLIDAGSEETLRVLTGALFDRDEGVRVAAGRALGRMGRRREAAAALARALGSREGRVRQQAAEALGEMGPGARDALPVLHEALRNKNDPERCALALALWRVERPVELSNVVVDRRQEALDLLIDVLRDRGCQDRADAAEALGAIGPDACRAVPFLVAAVRDGGDGYRREAIEALGAMGRPTSEVRSALRSALRHQDVYTRLSAARALCRLDHQDREAFGVLVQILEKHPTSFTLMHDTLAELGPDAKAAVPWLRRALRYEEYETYRRAADLLRKIDPEAAARAGVP
jgi:HEAT repeat protein